MEGQSSASAPLNIDGGSKKRRRKTAKLAGGRRRRIQSYRQKKWVRKQRPSKEKTERLRLPKKVLCAFKHGNKNLDLLFVFFLLVF